MGYSETVLTSEGEGLIGNKCSESPEKPKRKMEPPVKNESKK